MGYLYSSLISYTFVLNVITSLVHLNAIDSLFVPKYKYSNAIIYNATRIIVRYKKCEERYWHFIAVQKIFM
jgi:hypothetical protein